MYPRTPFFQTFKYATGSWGCSGMKMTSDLLALSYEETKPRLSSSAKPHVEVVCRVVAFVATNSCVSSMKRRQDSIKPKFHYADFLVTSAGQVRDKPATPPLARIPLRRLPRNFPVADGTGKSAWWNLDFKSADGRHVRREREPAERSTDRSTPAGTPASQGRQSL